MPDILLFGATGYTGRKTAAALQRRGASFAIAGRNAAGLEELAAEVEPADVRVADAGEPASLVQALEGCRVLVTCVGPFLEYGDAAVDAALEAGAHYIDSTGEGKFIRHLIARDRDVRAAGVAFAPAMGFDEVPCDVATVQATDGLDRPEVTATYAVPSSGSVGTIRSALGILTSPGRRITDGAVEELFLADKKRVAPMPPPLGPKSSMSMPLAMGDLAPLHPNLKSFETFVTADRLRSTFAQAGRAPLGRFIRTGVGKKVIDAALARLPEGPDDQARKKRWTILVEARSGRAWRNVAVQGADVYGLTTETLSAGAIAMAHDEYDHVGVLTPVQAFGVDFLEKELRSFGITFSSHEGS